MKTLYLLRHAKSSRDNPNLRDFDRPLNERGEEDAPAMAKYFSGIFSSPDKMIASPAARTTATASLFAMGIGYEGNIEYNSSIYEAHYLNLLEVVQAIANNVQSAMLVGHNPGMTNLANYLSAGFVTDNVPTCGLVALNFNVPHWHHLSEAQGELIRFISPKQLVD